MKNAFDLDNAYGKNGMLDEQGLSTLLDMHATLTYKNWNRAEAIKHIAGLYHCHKDKATAMIDWALNIFRRDTPERHNKMLALIKRFHCELDVEMSFEMAMEVKDTIAEMEG